MSACNHSFAERARLSGDGTCIVCLHAEVERLTKERDDHREIFTLSARTEKLEGALGQLYNYYNSSHVHGGRVGPCGECSQLGSARAALESGEGAPAPTPPGLFCHPCCGGIDLHFTWCSVIGRAPAPKTFTVEEADTIVEAATEAVSLAFEREERAISKGSSPYDRAFIRAVLWDDVASAIRRALGLDGADK